MASKPKVRLSFSPKSCVLAAGAAPDGCDWCGAALLDAVQFCRSYCEWQWRVNHVWRLARRERKHLDSYVCVRCGSEDSLEVNHKMPVLDRGYHDGCHHHLDRLETLCQPHHAEETTKQQRMFNA